MCRIHWFAEETDFVFPHSAAAEWLEQVIRQEKYILAQLNVIFCSDDYLHAYNLRYLQHDMLTDVLSFDYSDQASVLDGEVYISIDRIKENALIEQQPLLREACTVLVHGVLHLLGYTDNTPKTRALMRQKEIFYTAQAPFLRNSS